MSNATLESLLGESTRFSCEYADRLSSHLPMALVALSRLGADEERMQDFFRTYSRQLRLREAVAEPITDWAAHLGKPNAEMTFLAFFRQEVRAQGIESTLRRFLPYLISGIAGDAFHGLIRIGYAFDLRHESETAEGLTALAMSYLDLQPIVGSPRFASAMGAFDALREDRRFDAIDVSGPNIVTRVSKAAAQPAFIDYAYSIVEPRLEYLALIAAGIYANTNNFTALHLVTACHAMRLLLPLFDGSSTPLSHLATTMLAAYVPIGRPDFRTRAVESLPPWDEIAAVARRSNDDHVLKLVYTARCEFEHYGWPVYHYMAARKAGCF